MDNKKILFIDDDAALAEMYAIKFEKEGFQTKICTDGLTALGLISDYAPSVIFLDIMMPTINGYEVMEAIRSLITSVKPKIILFSNLGDIENMKRCEESGADACLLKANITPKDAIEHVKKILAEDADKVETIHECPHCHKSLKITISPN